MKQMKRIFYILAVVATLISTASCSTSKGLVFADREWHISDYYGQIIDKDTTYRMTFGDILIPVPLTIISSNDSVVKYPGMDRFLKEILHTARLDSAEILFYAPSMCTMFVKPKGAMPPLRPASVSSTMGDDKPYTMWVHEDDMEDWTRNPSEMYTYTYFDKKKKQILIVDFYDYGNEPIAQIFVFQTNTKATIKMNVPNTFYNGFYRQHDIGKYEKYIEFWSHVIDGHRKLAFANYKIGQEQKLRRK